VLFVLASLAHSPTSAVTLRSQRFSIFCSRPPSLSLLALALMHQQCLLSAQPVLMSQQRLMCSRSVHALPAVPLVPSPLCRSVLFRRKCASVCSRGVAPAGAAGSACVSMSAFIAVLGLRSLALALFLLHVMCMSFVICHCASGCAIGA
jgi:hypothetical protein